VVKAAATSVTKAPAADNSPSAFETRRISLAQAELTLALYLCPMRGAWD